MELNLLQELNNCEPMPPIYFKPDPTINNKSEDNQYYLKVLSRLSQGILTGKWHHYT